MDAGIAALWAAAIGAVSGLGGGGVGAWLTGKKQQSVAEQAARTEQERWLRQQRLTTYTNVLTAYDEFTSAVSPHTGPSRTGQPLSDAATTALNNTEYAVLQACARIRLVGPDSVRGVSRTLAASVGALSTALREGKQPSEVDPLVDAIGDAHAAFVDAARSVVCG